MFSSLFCFNGFCSHVLLVNRKHLCYRIFICDCIHVSCCSSLCVLSQHNTVNALRSVFNCDGRGKLARFSSRVEGFSLWFLEMVLNRDFNFYEYIRHSSVYTMNIFYGFEYMREPRVVRIPYTRWICVADVYKTANNEHRTPIVYTYEQHSIHAYIQRHQIYSWYEYIDILINIYRAEL